MPNKTKSAYNHSGTKKHNKKHSENPKWEHKDRSAGAIIGRAVNTIKDTGEKIGKGAEKIYKDAKETIKAGNKMSPYKLKPVPEGNKGKGLSKLPTAVRNKMGYMMDSSHSFKGNVANNMKTMYMGSVYYETDPKVDDVVVQGDTLKRVSGIDEDEEIKTVIKKKTVPGKVIGGGYKNKMSDEAWKKYLASETPEQKEARIKREIADGVREPNQEIEVKSDEVVKTKTPQFEDMTQKFDATGNFGRRQQMRGVIQGERKIKRANIKIAGLENRLSKAKPGSTRAKKLQAKLNAAKNKATRFGDIARQTEMQERQGLVGTGGGRKIEQNFTSSIAGGVRDTRKFGEQITESDANKMKNAIKGLGPVNFMKLSPKAMKYFNRKK